MEEFSALIGAFAALVAAVAALLVAAGNGKKWTRLRLNRAHSFQRAIQVSAGQIGPNGFFVKVKLLAKRN